MNKEKEIVKLQKVFNATLKLIALYKKCNLSIPFALKGNLGEIIVAIELLKRYPKSIIDYKGGAFPGVDIIIDNLKIQVKTQIKHSPIKFKNGEYDCEGCPSTKKSILDDKKCDFLVLVILYPNKTFSKIEKENIYIFGQKEFKFFSSNLCWAKNSYTIANILYVKGYPPKQLAKKIKFYNTVRYKQLFLSSRNNFNKIKIF